MLDVRSVDRIVAIERRGQDGLRRVLRREVVEARKRPLHPNLHAGLGTGMVLGCALSAGVFALVAMVASWGWG